MQLNVIKKMERYARHDTNIISLAQGIPAQGSHEHIRARVIEAIGNGLVDTYSDPQGLYELRRSLSEHLRAQGMSYRPSEIVVTNGAIEALGVALRSVVSDGRKTIIVPTPVYSAYFKLIELAGATAVEVPLDGAHNWALSVDAVIAQITDKTAAVLLCNPNNPTGTVYERKDLERIATAAKMAGAAVIVDEVYRNMVYDNRMYYSLASNDIYKDTVIRVMSFSKDFSLTGWRIGYLHASTSRIPSLLGVHDALVNCAPVVSQYAALAALEVYDTVIKANLAYYELQRKRVGDELQKLSGTFASMIPQGTYFFFPRIMSGEESSELTLRLLKQAGVVMVPGDAFGKGGERHVRICFGRDEKTLGEGLRRLNSTLGAQS